MANYDDLLNNAPAEEQGGQQLSKEEYAAKKKAEREGIFELSDEAALEVSADGGKFQPFLDLQARLDRYSAVNALLVFAQILMLPVLAALITGKGRTAPSGRDRRQSPSWSRRSTPKMTVRREPATMSKRCLTFLRWTPAN